MGSLVAARAFRDGRVWPGRWRFWSGCGVARWKQNGASGRTRTCNLLIRSQKLYPIELRMRGAGRSRTGKGKWGGRRDLNPRQPDPQSGALTRLSYDHHSDRRAQYAVGSSGSSLGWRRTAGLGRGFSGSDRWGRAICRDGRGGSAEGPAPPATQGPHPARGSARPGGVVSFGDHRGFAPEGCRGSGRRAGMSGCDGGRFGSTARITVGRRAS